MTSSSSPKLDTATCPPEVQIHLVIKCLTNPRDSTSLAAMKQKLIVAIRAIYIKKASARAVNLVIISKCL